MRSIVQGGGEIRAKNCSNSANHPNNMFGFRVRDRDHLDEKKRSDERESQRARAARFCVLDRFAGSRFEPWTDRIDRIDSLALPDSAKNRHVDRVQAKRSGGF
jgi:hypothetical protein